MACSKYITVNTLHKGDNREYDDDDDNNYNNNNDQLGRTIFNVSSPVTINLYSSSTLGTVFLVWFSVYILSDIKIIISQTFDVSTVYYLFMLCSYLYLQYIIFILLLYLYFFSEIVQIGTCKYVGQPVLTSSN